MTTEAVFTAQLGAAIVIAAVLVRTVMWRLAWLERRPVTPRMKRGTSRRWWLVAPAILAASGGLWWLGYPHLVRWVVALGAGAPFLLATERFWTRRRFRAPVMSDWEQWSRELEDQEI